jgi:CheY-like chemotaxis protein
MSKGRVLIVEDEKDLREVYELVLTHAGYEIFSSPNGQDGLEQLAKCNPQLVLLDIFMPVMDGKAFLENLDLSTMPKTKIVVCSNTSDYQLIDDMLKLGAEKVVTKSDLAPTDLTALVESYLTTT